MALCLVALLAPSAWAATPYRWIGSGATGVWTASANWDPTGVPGDGDSVEISANVGVTVPDDVGILSELRIDGGRTVTLTLGKSMSADVLAVGGQLEVQGAGPLRALSSVDVGSGADLRLDVPVECSPDAVMPINGGVLAATKAVTFGGASSMDVSSGASSGGEVLFSGPVTYEGPFSATIVGLGSPYWRSSSVEFFGPVTFTSSADVRLGTMSWLGLSGTMTYAGTVSVDLGASATLHFQDPAKPSADVKVTASGVGIVDFGTGSYELVDGFLDHKASNVNIDVAAGGTVTASATSGPVFDGGAVRTLYVGGHYGGGTLVLSGDVVAPVNADINVVEGGRLELKSGSASGNNRIDVDEGCELVVPGGATLKNGLVAFDGGTLSVEIASANRGAAPTMPAVTFNGTLSGPVSLDLSGPGAASALASGEKIFVARAGDGTSLLADQVRVIGPTALVGSAVSIEGGGREIWLAPGGTSAGATLTPVSPPNAVTTVAGMDMTSIDVGATLGFEIGEWPGIAADRTTETVWVRFAGEDEGTPRPDIVINPATHQFILPADLTSKDAEIELWAVVTDTSGREHESQHFWLVVGRGVLTGTLTASASSARVGQPVTFTVTWTHERAPVGAADVSTEWRANALLQSSTSTTMTYTPSEAGTLTVMATGTPLGALAGMAPVTLRETITVSSSGGEIDDGSTLSRHVTISFPKDRFANGEDLVFYVSGLRESGGRWQMLRPDSTTDWVDVTGLEALLDDVRILDVYVMWESFGDMTRVTISGAQVPKDRIVRVRVRATSPTARLTSYHGHVTVGSPGGGGSGGGGCDALGSSVLLAGAALIWRKRKQR